MKCKECGGTLRIYYTDDREGYVFRKRECTQCGMIYKTAELAIEETMDEDTFSNPTKKEMIEVFERYGYKVRQ